MKNTFHVTVKGFSKTDDVSQEEHEDCLAQDIKSAIVNWLVPGEFTDDVVVKPIRRV